MNALSTPLLHVDDLAKLRNVDERELVTIIDGQVEGLEKLKNRTYAAYSAAQSAAYKVSQAKFETAVAGLFTEDRKNFNTLMDCNKKLSEGLLALSASMEISFKNQERFAQSIETLFLLGCESMAENRRVSDSLAKALSNAKAKGYSEDTRERLIAVIKQLKSRQHVLFRMEKLAENSKGLAVEVSAMREELDRRNTTSLPSGLNERILHLEASTGHASSQKASKTVTILACVAGFMGFAMGVASLFLHH